MVAHHTHTRTHAYTHIRRHICSQMLAQCERQVRQGRSDILGPIRSRSSDRPCALTARKGHQFVFIGSSNCSMIWSIYSPLFTIFIWCFNQFGGRIVLSYLFGHSQNIAHVIKGLLVGMIKICYWRFYKIRHMFSILGLEIILILCWEQCNNLLKQNCWCQYFCMLKMVWNKMHRRCWKHRIYQNALVCHGLPWYAIVCLGML